MSRNLHPKFDDNFDSSTSLNSYTSLLKCEHHINIIVVLKAKWIFFTTSRKNATCLCFDGVCVWFSNIFLNIYIYIYITQISMGVLHKIYIFQVPAKPLNYRGDDARCVALYWSNCWFCFSIETTFTKEIAWNHCFEIFSTLLSEKTHSKHSQTLLIIFVNHGSVILCKNILKKTKTIGSRIYKGHSEHLVHIKWLKKQYVIVE